MGAMATYTHWRVAGSAPAYNFQVLLHKPTAYSVLHLPGTWSLLGHKSAPAYNVQGLNYNCQGTS